MVDWRGLKVKSGCIKNVTYTKLIEQKNTAFAEKLSQRDYRAKPAKDSDSEEVCDIEKRCSELYSELLEEKESARKCKEDFGNCKAEMSVLKEEHHSG